MSMTAKTNASTFWTASCPSAAARRPSAPGPAVSSSSPRGLPHRFWAPARPARLLLIVAPAGIEDYFHEINSASTDDERHQIGERFGIRVVTGSADGPAGAQS